MDPDGSPFSDHCVEAEEAEATEPGPSKHRSWGGDASDNGE